MSCALPICCDGIDFWDGYTMGRCGEEESRRAVEQTERTGKSGIEEEKNEQRGRRGRRRRRRRRRETVGSQAEGGMDKPWGE
jgi:hypothetical protein